MSCTILYQGKVVQDWPTHVQVSCTRRLAQVSGTSFLSGKKPVAWQTVDPQGVYNSWKSWKSPWICMVLLEILYKMSMIDHIGNHDKTGYLIASLRNWSPFFIFATVLCCVYHVFVIYLGKLVDSVHCIAGRSNANMSSIFLEIPSGISLKSPGNMFS